MKRGWMCRRESTASAGLKRSMCPTCSSTPRSAASAAMPRASSSVAAMGFSTSTEMPRSSSGHTTAWCRLVGTATETARTWRGSSSALVKAGTDSSPATWAACSGRLSTTPTSSAPGTCWSSRAWCRPRCPTPMTATGRRSALATQALPEAAEAPGLLAQQRVGQLAHVGAAVVDQVVCLLDHRAAEPEDAAVHVLDLVDVGLRDARARHADLVDHAHLGRVAGRLHEGRYVLHHAAGAADVAAAPDGRELVDAHEARQHHVVADVHVARDEHAVDQDAVVAHHAVMAHVAARHEHVVAADACDQLLLGRAAVDGH